ncbi:MAG TPA: flagellar protein FlaG [Thermoanaerobacterales bacterium]|nr:flagellar protein FlaG [Thermoanaerobacterales bacterium]
MRIGSLSSEFRNVAEASSVNRTVPRQDLEFRERSDETAIMQDFERVIGKEDYEKIMSGLREIAQDLKQTRFEFDIHDETKRVMVRIVDRFTEEVITEIPPEKFLDLIGSLWKQAGLIIDKRI